MIITRTPLRISLGGGGTDLPSYSNRFGGFVISAAINRYMFIAINKSFSDDYFLKYAELERVKAVSDIQHPIIREALLQFHLPPGVEIVSVADIPSGTGLGSSGSFTVGLLRALTATRREVISVSTLAEIACEIEIDRLGRPIGKQDQYIAALGGIQVMEFKEDGKVEAKPLRIESRVLSQLQDHLLMFFTGYSRDAAKILDEQKTKSEENDAEMVENLHAVKELGFETRDALEEGDPDRFGEIMNRHWKRKKERSNLMSNSRIDYLYDLALVNGATGGKLVGAGAGGFLLFYSKDPRALRAAMTSEGLEEVEFSFDFDGTTVLARD
jgi:D-glycero-alpha-D-manno-heptose-7-phosphate kinase